MLVRVSQVADDFPNPMYERNLQVMDMRQNHIHNSDWSDIQTNPCFVPIEPTTPSILARYMVLSLQNIKRKCGLYLPNIQNIGEF